MLDGMEFLSSRTAAPKTAHISFVKFAKCFEQIDLAMFHEMQRNIKICIQPAGELHQEAWSTSRFADRQPHKDRGVEDIKKSVSHTLSEADTLTYLADTAGLKAWSWVFDVLLGYQGPSNVHYTNSWTQAKSRALDILNFAQAVLDIYESDACQDLIKSGHENVGAAIELKLTAILHFDDIYSRVTFEMAKAPHKVDHHNFVTSLPYFVSRRKHELELSKSKSNARKNQDVSADSI